MSRKRRLSHLGARAFVRLQRWLERKTPEQAERIGAFLGGLAYRLSAKHRRIARENLRRAFPEMTPAEVEDASKGVLVHFGRVMADFMRSRRRTPDEVLASMQFEGLENLDRALAAGKGAMIITAHFGNWERLAAGLVAKGYKLSVIARDANDPEMNDLVNELRLAGGVGLISRGDAALPTLKRLKRNEVVGMLPDQNSDEIFVPFFGHMCGTVTGPAVLSLRSGAPLVPLYNVRVGVNKYLCWVEEPPVPEEGKDPVESLTRTLNLSLENAIRRYPSQYLWIHNRWKSAKRRGLVE